MATRSFVRSEVLPTEDEHDGDVEAAGGEDLRTRLQALARARDLLTPHGPMDLGGGGLNMRERAWVFEEADYALFGPMAINANPPMRATCTCSITSPPQLSASAIYGPWSPASGAPPSR